MKNIHLLPTNKPSQLFHYIERPDKFFLDLKRERIPVSTVVHKNIYITNDEEIKEGSIVLSTFDNWKGTLSLKPIVGKIIKIEKDAYLIRYYSEHFGEIQSLWDKGHSKKIILTTDPDLIKDGVQAIDDEFLEWFVKNPSCESVKIDHERVLWEDGRITHYTYRVIIPKEEPKQETLEEAAKDFIENTMKFSFTSNDTKTLANRLLKCVEFGAKWQQEKREREQQETLEEASFRFYPEDEQWTDRHIFTLGAKWQQEQDRNKYSEEEVRNLLIECCGEVSCEDGTLVGKSPAELVEWIDTKFKKK